MRFWGVVGKIPRVYALTRNKSQPEEDTSRTRNDISKDNEGGAEANRKDHRP